MVPVFPSALGTGNSVRAIPAKTVPLPEPPLPHMANLLPESIRKEISLTMGFFIDGYLRLTFSSSTLLSKGQFSGGLGSSKRFSWFLPMISKAPF
jgi:hypothetical protein